jgi:hypothetical protein
MASRSHSFHHFTRPNVVSAPGSAAARIARVRLGEMGDARRVYGRISEQASPKGANRKKVGHCGQPGRRIT